MGKTAENDSLLLQIESAMRRMLAGECLPYDAAWEIFGLSMKSTTSPDLLHPMWLIWGALTDWQERRPEETPQAEEAMRRAAREWLAIDSQDAAARKAYFDRWVYDEMGYSRPEPQL